MKNTDAVDQRFHLPLEVLGRLRRGLNLARQHEAHPGAPSHLDGDVLPLVGANARETQQEGHLLRRRHHQVLHVNGVVHRANPREVRQGAALRSADGDKARLVHGRGVEGGVGLRDVAVHRVHDWGDVRGTCGHKCREAAVVMNDVNVAKLSERRGYADCIRQLAKAFVGSAEIRAP